MRLREFDEKEQLLKANEKLTKYKTAAGANAAAADASGNFARGNTRFKGINRATKKQFANDAKLAKLKEFAEQGVAEAEKKGLYYYVNKRKKAGTSRDASSPKAPSAQSWKDAAKTAKKEGVAEALDSNFVGFMNKTLGQKADAPTDKSPMPDFMKGAPVAGLDSMGYRAALDFGMKTLRKLTPTQKTKLSIKGEDGVVNWLANQAKKQGLLITDESDEDTQGKFMQEDLDEVQDFLPEVFHDPAIKSWAFVLTDGEPLPKAPVAGPFKVGINPGVPGQNGYANADWKTVDTLENLPDARDLAQGLSQKNPKQFVAIWAANGKGAGFYWPGEGWRGIDEGVAEEWSQKYKSSINCSHPKGFSQRAHCAGKKKHNESIEMEMVCEDCGMCQSHGSLNEIAKGAKDANSVTKCWPGKHAEGTKTGKNGGQVRNCVPNESVAEDSLAAMRRLAGVTTPAAVPNGLRQYRHMPTAVQPR